MTPRPTGRVVPFPGGRDLVLTRTFAAPVDDVWASITEPDRTARWFGHWTGEAGPGRTIRIRLGFEDEAPECDMVIEACEPPHHLAVTMNDEHGDWHLAADLAESGGVTTLTLTHHLADDTDLGSIGPGWEYYLDLLVAYREGRPQPGFDDYYPAQKAYYDGLGRP